MNEPMILLLTALICLSLGLVLGNMFSRQGGDKPDKSAPNSAPGPNMMEIGHLWRDLRRGDLVLQLQGKTHRSANGLNASQRSRLTQAVQELHGWLGILSTSAPAHSEPAAEPAASSTPLPGIEYTPPLPSEPPKKLSMNPIDVITRAVTSDVKSVSTEKSIAAQIDEILQDKLVDSPLEKKAIRLLELPAKGMVVMVGLDQYDGVDAVPDEAIRNLIRESVAEWERRTA